MQQEKKHPERLLESIKYEVRKYLKRERKKKLPEDATYWEFDCRFGANSDNAESLPASEIITALDRAYEAKWDACYIEILAKAIYKEKKSPVKEDE